MKICPYCESELSDTARKCKFCGEWVTKKEIEISFSGDKCEYLSDEEFIKCLEKGAEGTNQLKCITDVQAEKLANFDFLSQYKCYELSLNGLEIITDNQAKIFSKYQGRCISLDGLEKISEKQLKYLSEFNPERFHPFFELSLNGLKHITDEQAEIITSFKGSGINLNGLSSITDKQIEYFDQFLEKNRYNCHVKLEGLLNITDKQAEIFSNMKQIVILDKVMNITDKQAEIFSNFEGTMLSLEGLEKISEKQIEYLSEFPGLLLQYKINNNKVRIDDIIDIDYCRRYTTVEGLDSINNSQLATLIKYNPELIIEESKSITDKQAEIFSNFEGDYLCIDGIDTLSYKQTEFLSHFKGKELRLIVKKINKKRKKKLVDSLGDRISIEGNEYDDGFNTEESENQGNTFQDDKHGIIKVFFFDTETTGKDPHVEQIIQFGGIYGAYNKNTGKFEEKDRINQLVRPTKKIPEEASKVHGLYNKDLEGYGLIGEYIYEFLSFIKKADFVVGHNVEYDKTILIAETKRLNIPFNFSKVKWIDTMKPCTSLVQIPAPERSNDKYKRPKLIELHKFLFGKEFEDAHDAMADITATKDCFVELCNKYNFYENGKFKEEIERYQNENKEENVTNEEIKQKDISEMHKEFQELQHITNKLGEAQSKIKNVECVYNNETGDIRYRIDGDYYNDNDIVNVDGYVFLKKYVVEFNGKPYIKSHNDLYEFQDIEGTDKFNGIPKKGAKSVAKRVITVSSGKLIGYFKPEDVVVVDGGGYFPKKEAIKIKFNGKDYFFRSDDDYVLNKYLKKDWNGNFCLKSNCSIIDETDTKGYYWVKCSGSILDKTIVQWLIYLGILIALFYFGNR